MNFVDISKLPTFMHRGKQSIDWKNTVGYSIDFKYNHVSGQIEILDYTNPYLKISYKGKIFKIQPVSLISCKLGIFDCIYFTHETKKYLSEEDALKYKPQANIYLDYTCDICGLKQSKWVNAIYNWGFRCNQCSDGISYPEKFMISVLNQLNINYEQQYKIEIDGNKKYFDFVISEGKLIIEVDGGFHFRTTKFSNHSEVQENDAIKEKWAYENNFSVIRINALKSTTEYMSNEIFSKLNSIFDLSLVNFNEAGKFALTNYVKLICDYKIKNPELYASDIANKFNLSDATVIRYLNLGNESGLIEYNTKDESKRRYDKLSKSIHVISNDIIVKSYKSINECSRNSLIDFGVKFTCNGITSVLKERTQTHRGYKFKYQK